MVTCQPQTLTPEQTTPPPAHLYRQRSPPEIRRQRWRTEIVCNLAEETMVEVNF